MSATADACAETRQTEVHRLPEVIVELLRRRGVQGAEQVQAFLHPSFSALLDPFSMLGMDAAVARIQQAIARRETILLYGDYDVDGTLAVVLLKTALELLGATVHFHIPHRLRDGYGMQANAMAQAAADGVRLVISVDNGIRAYAAANEAQRLGLDLIITDHHLPDAAQDLPAALAILNPNQPGCPYACKHLCGAGVAFKLAQALLEARDRERARNRILPSFLKLLALATVADAVPLLGENRAIAALGMEQLAQPVHPGLRALFVLAEIDASRRLRTHDIAFRIAPRLNAAGRMGAASDVVELFTTRDPAQARALAEKLHRLNEERRRVEQQALETIERRLSEDAALAAAPLLVLDGEGWHRGVLGILAARVVDRTGKPALVVTHEDGEAHGSGRSVEGFHLLNAIESCSELFTRHGGHAQAVGFSLPSMRVPELRERLCAYAADHPAPGIAANELAYEVELPLDRLTPALAAWVERLAPFGMENPEPVFLARAVHLCGAPRVMKERHLRLLLAQQRGGAQITALAWNWAARFAALGLGVGTRVDVAYRIRPADGVRGGAGRMELEIAGLRAAE